MSDKTPPLKEITKLGMFFGRISEVHIKNLKAFPWIFFNGLIEAKLDYDVGTKKEDSSWVAYDLAIKEENDHLDKRYKALEEAVRAIFWKEMALKVSINGNEVYKSE